MKTKSILEFFAAALLLSTLNSQLSTAFGQGSLTPPGAPGPMMKTLDQIEPCTPIASVPYTITHPGSYYLTTNVSVSTGDAITIATNNVTLDLKGFTISSTAASATGHGIKLNSGLRNITIQNGFIQGGVTNNGSGVYNGPGFSYGIYSGTSSDNVLVSRISVSGCLYSGIYLNLGASSVVESCIAQTVGNCGIWASTIKSSSAIDCAYNAINGRQVSDCRGASSTSGDGVYAITAQNCEGYSNGDGFGVAATTALNCEGTSFSGFGVAATTALNCQGTSESGTGVNAAIALSCRGFSEGSGTGVSAGIAQNCYGHSVSGPGVSAITAQNCYGSSEENGDGVYATTAQNCYGESFSGTGLYATRTAIGCNGVSSSGIGLVTVSAAFCTGSRASGTAIQATIANGCYAVSGTNNITYKYNMP